jgi:predicted ester cyclase
MITDADRAAAHRLLDAFNLRNPALVDEAVVASFLDHAVPPGMPPGADSLKRFVGMLTQALPDFRFTIAFEVAEGRVVEHWDVIDQLALRTQLGIPLPAASPVA